MKIVIDVPEERYKDIQRIAEVQLDRRTDTVEQIVAKGTPIEKTDGDLISREIEKADFLMAKVKDFERTAIRVKHNTEIIDRLIDYIHGVIVNAEKDHFVIGEERKYALREKFKLPSAEKTAEWINQTDDDLAINDYQCSKCDYWTEYNTKYCPNCGCKMKGAEE